jgi:hypothetical protein
MEVGFRVFLSPKMSDVMSVQDAEKAHLRTALLARLDEPHTPIAKQLALVVAKITRNDWPDAWPELFPSLVSSVQNCDEVMLPRHREILFHFRPFDI